MDLGTRLEAVERLGRLRDEGAISEEEFQAAKASALHQGVPPPGAPATDDPDEGGARRNAGWIIGAMLVGAIAAGAYLFVPRPQETGGEPLPETNLTAESLPAQQPAGPSAEETDLDEAAAALEAAGSAVEEAASAVEPPPPPAAAPSRAPVQPVRYEPREAAPVRDLQSYVTSDDYPQSSIERGEQGVVRFTLTIGSGGRATDCAITASSGYRALDTATCNIMMRRARFTPAYDAEGMPVDGSVSSGIGWRIAN